MKSSKTLIANMYDLTSMIQVDLQGFPLYFSQLILLS
jgi:hypothetical protein